jgi:hypothetical protein
MPRTRFACLLAAALMLALPASATAPKEEHDTHRFGVIGHSFARGGESKLKAAIEATGEKSLAFVVVTGIKGALESCSDKLYSQRHALIDDAQRPVIVVPAGTDWIDCRNSAGRSSAIERLNRMRELFYSEPVSLGEKKLAVTRLAMSPRFRSYAENAHWEVGKVLYATLNLPAKNNHYLSEAGRNSEYEDRLVANRYWLGRLFALARRDKLDAVVLFSEGDLKALSQPSGLRALLRRTPSGHDGFAETRRLVLAQAEKFSGKVLLIDSAGGNERKLPSIEWRGNVGQLSTGAGALEVQVTPGSAHLFKVQDAAD